MNSLVAGFTLTLLPVQVFALHIPQPLLRRSANSLRAFSNATSGLSSTSTSPAVGTYIAAGLNPAAQQTYSASSSEAPMSVVKSSGNITSSATVKITSASSTSLATGIAGLNSTVEDPTWSNSTLDTQCWAQWDDYWSLTEAASSMFTTYTTTFVDSAVSYQQLSSIYPITTTVTQSNGNFPTKTYITTILTTSVISEIPQGSETVTGTRTTRVNLTITSPPCILPTYVPQCQSSWESWVGSQWRDQPGCTQASISGSLCTSVVSEWLAEQEGANFEISGKVGLQFTEVTTNGSTTEVGYWPKTSEVAPGCTIGCQTCRVSGSRVKLLYWPPQTTGYRNGTFFATTTAGNKTGPVTAVAGDLTLTSPTVYISFDRLYASDSCSVRGTTVYNTILAITNTATLSSLWGWGHYNYQGFQDSASFNFTDLYVTPVPQSIYQSQPRCASSSAIIQYSCLRWGTTGPPICKTALSGGFVCATTLPYEPVISIPAEAQQLQPEWAGCIGGLIGVYDPPSALQPAPSADSVTVPKMPATTAVQTTSAAAVSPTTAAVPSPTASSVAVATQSSTTAELFTAVAPGPEPENTSSQDEHRSSDAQPVTVDPQLNTPTSTNALDVLTQAQASPTNANPSEGAPSQSPAGQSSSAMDPSAGSPNQDSAIQSPSAAAPGASQPLILSPGGAAVTTNGRTISLGSSGVIIDGTTAAFSQALPASPANAPAAVVTIGSSAVTAQQSQAIILSDTTISRGADPVTVNGQTISVGSAGVVIDGTTATYSANSPAATNSGQPAAAVTIGSSTLNIQPGQPLTISGTPISAGGDPLTIQGQTISLDSSAVVIDGSTTSFAQPQPQSQPPPSNAPPAAVFTLGSSTFTAQQNQPLTIGADPGNIFSNNPAPAPSQVSSALASLLGATQPLSSSTTFQLGSDIIIIANPSTTVLLTPGGPTPSLSGQTISLQPNGALIIGSSTVTSLPSHALPQSTANVAAAETLSAPSNGGRYTASAQGSGIIVVAGPSGTATLAVGEATTIAAGGEGGGQGGHTLSANGNGVVIDGSSTLSLDTSSATGETFIASNGEPYATAKTSGAISSTTTSYSGSTAPSGSTRNTAPSASLLPSSASTKLEARGICGLAMQASWLLPLLLTIRHLLWSST